MVMVIDHNHIIEKLHVQT